MKINQSTILTLLLSAVVSCGGGDDYKPFVGPDDGKINGDDEPGYIAPKPGGGTPPSDASVPPAVADHQSYNLIWYDEFDLIPATGKDYAVPSHTKWSFETGGHGWGNNELQYYVDCVYGDDVTAMVRDGNLSITAHKITGSAETDNCNYISTRMNSISNWTYGYFEMRAKMPGGRGTWPAFWMLPTVYTGGGYSVYDGELDIMEYVGAEPGVVHFSAHSSKYTTGVSGPDGQPVHSRSKNVPGCETEFHTYAMEWTPDYVKGLVDGDIYFTYENPKFSEPEENQLYWPYHKPFYMKLNMAVGGSWGGYNGVDDSIFPVSYIIDYVRVFQK